MSNLREYQNRIADIAKRSKAVLGWASTAQFGTDNQFIKDDAARAASILEAARKTQFLRVSLIMPPLKLLPRGQVHWLTTPQHINLCRVRKFWPPATRRWKTA